MFIQEITDLAKQTIKPIRPQKVTSETQTVKDASSANLLN